MTPCVEEWVSVRRPAASLALPLICDSPHSGTSYPADFGARLPMALLRQAEDTDVDALWSEAVNVGATLISARFPCSYIDPHRAIDDLDASLMDGAWPGTLAPGEKSSLGVGLVWSRLDAAHAIYDRRLSVEEVQQRISRCWRPYRQALAQAVADAAFNFGEVWHLNLHSAPGNACARPGLRSSQALADFVLSEGCGVTCEPEFIDVVERGLRSFGYRVARNDPYKGAAWLGEIGPPALQRHSLQIEIRRPLYMNEATRERGEHFEVLRWQLGQILRNVAQYVQFRLGPGL